MALDGNKLIRENIQVALRSIRSQLLKTSITVAMIMLGIAALILINTAAEALKSKVKDEFTALGANTFSVYAKNARSSGGRRGIQAKKYEPIDYHQAKQFSKEYDFPAIASISAMGSMTGVVKFDSKKTNPNVQIIGGDENYLEIAGYKLAEGRNFTETDIIQGTNVVLIGSDLVSRLFGDIESPIDKVVSIGSYKFIVIGLLKSKGTSLGFSNDNQCFIPISNLKKNFASPRTSYRVNVLVANPEFLEQAISEAHGVLRIGRGDQPGEAESFEIEKSDSTAEMLNDVLGQVSWFVIAIGLLTLLGAGIGLMNIMLVSVTERTREIGVRKAMGASASIIRMQFLVEAIVIGQIGGLLGIIFGVLAGNMIGFYLDTPFTIPWAWTIVGVTLSFLTSVASGYYPAKKASLLDPIDALRHE
jgi:putative ABC transport system permease protein